MLVSVESTLVGKILSEDVVLPNGSVLVNAGCVLNEHVIEMLKKRGILQVQIPENVAVAPKTDTALASRPTPTVTPSASLQRPPVKKPLPKIVIVISKDGLLADLTIDTSGAKDESASLEEVNSALLQAGVLYGVDEKKVAATLDKFLKTRKTSRTEGIAHGTLPIPGREGGFSFKVKMLADTMHCTAVRSATHFWQLVDLGVVFDRVDPGTVIAERLPGTPPTPGMTVKGEQIPIAEIQKSPITFDAGITFSRDGSLVISKVTGVAFFSNNQIGVVEISFDGSADITLENERLLAYCMIHPAGIGGNLPDQRTIEALLMKNGVIFGLDTGALTGLYAQLRKGQCPSGKLTIAKGSPPVHGENGVVEFLFPTETSLKPKVNEDGSVDFKSLGIIHSAAKGQVLARLKPPTKGVPGKDVTGVDISAKDGVPTRLPVGTNTEIDTAHTETLLAATDGFVIWNGNTVEIHEGYVIKGDVCYETGNVKYVKSVVVKGDIKSGFNVEVGGDLEVGGTIEDSAIQTGGNVLCKHGFLGQGKGSIDSKGDVNIGFLKNQTIKSRKNVNIAREALGATIFARNAICIYGKPLSVAGGHLLARDSISVHTVGNQSQIKTTLEVGVDFTMLEELQKTEINSNEINDNRIKLLEPIKKLDQQLQIFKRFQPKEKELYLKLKQAVARYEQQIAELEERKKLIMIKMQATENAVIHIEHSAMPGTTLKIGDRFFQVREEIVGPKNIRLIKEQIRIL